MVGTGIPIGLSITVFRNNSSLEFLYKPENPLPSISMCLPSLLRSTLEAASLILFSTQVLLSLSGFTTKFSAEFCVIHHNNAILQNQMNKYLNSLLQFSNVYITLLKFNPTTQVSSLSQSSKYYLFKEEKKEKNRELMSKFTNCFIQKEQ